MIIMSIINIMLTISYIGNNISKNIFANIINAIKCWGIHLQSSGILELRWFNTR